MALFPNNRGLIRRVIDINGGSGSWKSLVSSCRRKRILKQQGQAVAAAVGCSIYRRQEMVDCLRRTDNRRLAALPQAQADWTPVVDQDIIKVLTKCSRNILVLKAT